ncbi:MAG: nucleoid-associated protein, partial [Lentisphaeria bacterium]|nr:nucleoid-associated protein [Lentisphaeria bacterium]
CFHHHSALDQNEMYACAREIFGSEDGLLERGCDVAKRLYAKSNHPNIKSGDLCITLIKDIIVDGERTEGLCILKSESVEPFLSISARGGDLQLSTREGINPDKIDKGCLVLNHREEGGYHVLTFDRSSGESRFWVRDFLGLKPIPDEAYMTNQYAEMAVAFAKDQPVGVAEQTAKAKEAVEFFDQRERFSLQEFEEEVLRKDPEMVRKFKEHKERTEQEQGQKLDDSFGISQKDVSKAKRRVGGVMKLDTGVELRLLPHFQKEAMEKGYDEDRKMEFVKIYFNSDLEQQ